MPIRSTASLLTLCLCLVAPLAGGCDEPPTTLRPDAGMGGDITGEMAYSQPMPGGNTFACGTCHALSEPASDFRRPGHPIGDAANRPSYKNGQLTSFLDAVNTCVVEWMGADALEAGDQRWVALEGYLQEQAGEGAAPALSFDIVQPPADLEGGDVTEGATLFDGSCAVCHGAGATGTERAPALVGASALDAEFIAQRVRTSGDVNSRVYEGLTDGRMPFWSADRLSDDELRDLIAFVLMVSMETPVGADAGPPAADAGPVEGCTSDHASVGSTAVLTERFHDVGGTATIVDDCTIRIDDFTFDGTGIDVRLYGGLAGNFRDGFGIGPDLRRATPYAGETLTFRLPEGSTLDDLDGVSVWCVPAGVDFGSGSFAP